MSLAPPPSFPQEQHNWLLLKLTQPRKAQQGKLASTQCMKELTCNGSPAAEKDLLGHWVVRWGAKFGHHNGQHQILCNLLALLAVTELQMRHVREGRNACHLQRHLHHALLC